MKALTVRQPHAQLIALGVKTIETRTKPTKYRGPLLIHAAGVEAFSQGSIVGEWQLYRSDRQDRPMARRTRMHKTDSTISVILPLGAIVASCKLVDCVPVEKIEWVRADWNNNLTWWKCASRYPVLYALTKQQPYGDFTPGRFAWLLEDIQPTTERCPACWGGQIHWTTNAHMAPPYETNQVAMRCPVCEGSRVTSPILAKGKQGLWEWTP